MEFRDNVVRFNIPDSLQHTNEDHSIFKIELLEFLVQEAMPKIISKQLVVKFFEPEIGE